MWMESVSLPERSKKLVLQIRKIEDFRRNLERRFVHQCLSLAHNGLTVLAGPGAHRVSGRTAVTSRRGFGTHVSEGVRRAGMLWVRHQCVIAQEADHPRVIVHGKNME